jgi:hypothetical protein
MRILEVSGYDDYGALSFENEHGGKSVIEIMDNLDQFQPEEEGTWTLEVHTIQGSLTPEDAKLIKRNFIDYDHRKHKTFYAEGEKV